MLATLYGKVRFDLYLHYTFRTKMCDEPIKSILTVNQGDQVVLCSRAVSLPVKSGR